MKVKTLSLLAGVGAPLILTGSADAGFNGIYAIGKPNPFGLVVCNVYAQFDNAGNDRMQAVAGTPNHPMNISIVTGGSFWNHLAYDTFVTIGVKATGPLGQPADNLILANFPQPIAGTSISTTNGAYAVSASHPQGNPFDPINSFPGDGRILIGQFSTPWNGSIVGIQGIFLMQFVSDGVVTQSVESFSHFVVPVPGALGLFGLAGLRGTRRRR